MWDKGHQLTWMVPAEAPNDFLSGMYVSSLCVTGKGRIGGSEGEKRERVNALLIREKIT